MSIEKYTDSSILFGQLFNAPKGQNARVGIAGLIAFLRSSGYVQQLNILAGAKVPCRQAREFFKVRRRQSKLEWHVVPSDDSFADQKFD